jgi:hypothetical protein
MTHQVYPVEAEARHRLVHPAGRVPDVAHRDGLFGHTGVADDVEGVDGAVLDVVRQVVAPHRRGGRPSGQQDDGGGVGLPLGDPGVGAHRAEGRLDVVRLGGLGHAAERLGVRVLVGLAPLRRAEVADAGAAGREEQHQAARRDRGHDGQQDDRPAAALGSGVVLTHRRVLSESGSFCNTFAS